MTEPLHLQPLCLSASLNSKLIPSCLVSISLNAKLPCAKAKPLINATACECAWRCPAKGKECGLKSSPVCWPQLHYPTGGASVSCSQRLHNASWGPVHDCPSTLHLFPCCCPVSLLASPSFQGPGFKALEWGIHDGSISQFPSKSFKIYPDHNYFLPPSPCYSGPRHSDLPWDNWTLYFNPCSPKVYFPHQGQRDPVEMEVSSGCSSIQKLPRWKLKGSWLLQPGAPVNSPPLSLAHSALATGFLAAPWALTEMLFLQNLQTQGSFCPEHASL